MHGCRWSNRQSPQAYDVIALDAFSGDAIPAHLLTVEAFAVYRRHLKPTGVIAVHTSNRHLNLRPIVALIAQHYNMQVVGVYVEDAEGVGDSASEWLLVTNNEDFLQHAVPSSDASNPLDPPDPAIRVWTDQYSNLFQILTVWEKWKKWWYGEDERWTRKSSRAETGCRSSFLDFSSACHLCSSCRASSGVRRSTSVSRIVSSSGCSMGREQGQLDVAARAFGAAGADLGTSLFVQMFGLQLGQNLLGTLVHAARHAGQPGHVNAVALVGCAGDDLVQEYDLVFPLLHGHVEIRDSRQSCWPGR